MSPRVAQLTATKRERIRREKAERVKKRCEEPAVKAKLLVFAETYFKEKFEKIWPHIGKDSRMDREAAWVAFLAGVVACRAYTDHPPAAMLKFSRELARPKEGRA